MVLWECEAFQKSLHLSWLNISRFDCASYEAHFALMVLTRLITDDEANKCDKNNSDKMFIVLSP